MTRASKLAVALWGVMVLSGCAMTRLHDKPDASHTNQITKNKKQKPPVDKTTVAYARGLDSLKTALQKEGLDVLNAPMKYSPVAAQELSFEKYALNGKKTEKPNFFDTTRYTQRGNIYRSFFGTTVVPIVDCDEILHQADSADYISYPGENGANRLIATKDLRELRSSVTEFSGGSPADTKLYISFEPRVSAAYMTEKQVAQYGMNPAKRHVVVTSGYLETHDLEMTKSTARHEETHEETWAQLIKDVNAVEAAASASGGGIEMGLLTGLNRYMEYSSDSLGFATENKNGKLANVKPVDLAAVRRRKSEYQKARADIATSLLDLSKRSMPMFTPQEMMAYTENKKFLVAESSYNDTLNAGRTHPTHVERIYYTIIHQRRAKELQENGKTVLYEQYGDLLPKKPAIVTVPPPRQKAAQNAL